MVLDQMLILFFEGKALIKDLLKRKINSSAEKTDDERDAELFSLKSINACHSNKNSHQYTKDHINDEADGDEIKKSGGCLI
ncbi:hypothetical protein KR50_12920 [Jeotgalibacillus campisalis]|uniref:Uncharacterized protein n=1 Tax=Jeotgalibacillus campisalis TaxID=220754 RepID=A0A0C2VIJ7_9BACL|nr:hypothetical protein KR50_12920 [Jeotgalibacillus campisalis]